jgi:hypothetical protein
MARDKIHEVVKKAVENDGWEITDDPLILLFEDDSIAIDLAAEKIIIAEKGTKKIAIEIKTFDQPSLIYEFHKAIGQYFNYQTAIPETILNKLLQNHIIKKSIERIKMKLIVVNLETSKIVEWIN